MKRYSYLNIKFYIVCIFLFSCYNGKDKFYSQTNPKQLDTIYQSLAAQTAVYFIEQNGEVDSEFTGYGGRTTSQYLQFLKLSKYATTSDLVTLTNHKCAAVKAYAFMALISNKDRIVYDIFQKHALDTQSFILRSGCIGMTTRINDFFGSQLSSLNKKY